MKHIPDQSYDQEFPPVDHAGADFPVVKLRANIGEAPHNLIHRRALDWVVLDNIGYQRLYNQGDE